MKSRKFVVFAVFAAFLSCAAQAAGQSKTDEAKTLLDKMKNDSIDVWDASVSLEKLGPDVTDVVVDQLDALNPEYRMAAARALCKMGDLTDGVNALGKIVSDQPNKQVARDAAELLGEYGRSQAEGVLMHLLEKQFDPTIKIALARSLWSAATTEEAWQKANTTLRETFDEVKGDDLKECALALAEINDFNDRVVAILEKIQAEPGHRGGQARALLDLKKLRELSRHNARVNDTFRDPVLREIAARLQAFHVEEPKNFEELRDAAAKGMASSLDPFTNYFDSDEYSQFRQSMSGEYAGIGARVGFLGDVEDPQERLFCVIRPIYSGPAYEAGLRSYDVITAIDGEPTKGKELDKLVESLKGHPDTKVNLTISRQSLKGEKVISVERRLIHLDSVYQRVLPGRIGYLKLLHFGTDAVEEFKKGLDDLEAQGIDALIVDLRNNPGGLLSAAVDICDMFLKNNKLIVRAEGRDPRIVPEERYYTKDPATRPDYPLVLLVNGNSASASEIVSGALQDYKRAVLVGERTYGKGSVQRLMELESDGRQSALKVTIAKYYLPSGRSIHRTHTHRGGVKPDIEIEQEARLDSRDSGKFEELRMKGCFNDYTSKYFEKYHDLLATLCDFDNEDTSRYPGFEDWYQSLPVPISRESARYFLRAWLRICFSDERGSEYVVDLQDDDQLARGIAEALKMLNKTEVLKGIPQYENFLTRFKLEKSEK